MDYSISPRAFLRQVPRRRSPNSKGVAATRRKAAIMAGEERAGRAEVEARLLQEADRVVASLETALAAAPEDEELREQLERIVEQARTLRSRVQETIAKAHARRGS